MRPLNPAAQSVDGPFLLRNLVSFKSFNLDPRIEDLITSAGYETPTPIQAQAIPVVLEGKDILGLAQTGTGKTAAFVLPIIHKLAQTKSRNIRALIIAPTRELAHQIFDTVQIFGRPLGVKAMTCYGGANYKRQVHHFKNGVDIVVGCPGRILDHIKSQKMNVSGLEVLVLDEADQMFDMGFIPSIRQIIQKLPRQKQTLLFSATMPPKIKSLANEVQRNPVTIQVGQQSPTTSVTQAFFPVSNQLKPLLVAKLLEHTDTESVLIFVRTKIRAKRLYHQLADKGFRVTSLHGDLSPGERKESMNGFRSGAVQIMVATDIAARGIDISNISHVINFDIPDTVEAYIHRIGRTGRAAKTGDAFTLIGREDSAMVRDIEKRLNKTLEKRTLPGFDYRQQAPSSNRTKGGNRYNRNRDRPVGNDDRQSRGSRRFRPR